MKLALIHTYAHHARFILASFKLPVPCRQRCTSRYVFEAGLAGVHPGPLQRLLLGLPGLGSLGGPPIFPPTFPLLQPLLLLHFSNHLLLVELKLHDTGIPLVVIRETKPLLVALGAHEVGVVGLVGARQFAALDVPDSAAVVAATVPVAARAPLHLGAFRRREPQVALGVVRAGTQVGVRCPLGRLASRYFDGREHPP
eukprot:scaffold105688_cov60-Phaeocystis_antarctica.AAC.2